MDTLMLVYKGKSSEDLYTASFDGRSWHGNTKIRDEPGHLAPQSDRGPGVAVYNNWLYLLYKGDSSNDLYTAWWDGKRWNGNLKISDQRGGVNPQSNRGPNLAVYKGLLFTVYKGGSHDDLYSAWFDGTTWYGDTRLEEQPGGISPESNHNPGMAVFDDKLYIVYKGASSDKLYLAWFDGRRWAGNVAISEMPGGISPKSDHRPSAISFDGKLYLVYKGASSSHLYTAWFDGSKWSGNTKIKEQPGGVDPESNEGPSAQIYDGKLYIVYKGASSDALYTAWFDGSTWRGNTKISEQPGGIDPESNHQPGVALAVNTPTSRLDWMRFLPDSLSIGQINVPGTHDSAAINTSIHTPYATQNQSIRHQLDFGIRLLDVRIQVAQDGSRYTFTTCHGDIGSDHGINLYQSLPSLLGECRDFLGRNPSEVVLLSLKVDDWSNTKSRQEALAALQDLLNEYPVKTAASLPTLGTTRGHIFLFNRINDDLALGTPISWSDNTTGSYAKASSNRGYPVYVQDRYKDLPTVGADAEKLRLVIAAFDHKPSSAVVWNFASATWYGVFGVYIQGDLLSYFGKDEAADRLENFGWTLFDYPFSSYDTTTYGSMNIVSLIISSNFGYLGYEKKFKVLGEG